MGFSSSLLLLLALLWRSDGVEEEKFLVYASHSGLGNQVRALKNALVIAMMSNRTLVVPPPLHHYEIKRASVCNNECMAELALKFYEEIPGNFLEIVDVKNGPPVVPYSSKFGHPVYDFTLNRCQEKAKDACVAEDWNPFLKNPEKIVMISSALIWPKGQWRNFGSGRLPSFAWKREAPLFAEAQAALNRPYSCLYIRHSDLFDDLYKPPEYMEKPPTPDQRLAGRMKGFKQIADRISTDANLHIDTAYVASNVPSAQVCEALKSLNVIQNCLSTPDIDPDLHRLQGAKNSTNMLPLSAQSFLDMYACSQATEQSHCFISNERAGGTFWATIVEFSDDKNDYHPKCTSIDESYDFGDRMY